MRSRIGFLGVALLTFFLSAPARAGADTITITSGFLDWPTSTGAATLVLNGTGGFSWSSLVSPAGGILTPTNTCNFGFDCTAGSSVSLYAHWTGNDLTGDAVYQGTSYDGVGLPNSSSNLSVSFTGSFVVPPGSGNLVTTAPFLFSGLFIHPNTHSAMDGAGTATIWLSQYVHAPSAFGITHLRYEFGSPSGVPTPEPASMLLFGAGLVVAAVVRRHRRMT